MANCANCSDPAGYVYEPTPGNSTLFCDTHLPGFTKKAEYRQFVRSAADVVSIAVEVPAEEPAKPKAPKKTTEEPVAEEGTVEG